MTYYNRITTCLAQNKLSVPDGWLDNNSDGSSADGGDSGSGSAASGGGASAGGLALVQNNLGGWTSATPVISPLIPITPGNTIIIAGTYVLSLSSIVDDVGNDYVFLYNEVDPSTAIGVFIAYANNCANPSTFTFDGPDGGIIEMFELTPVTPQPGSPFSETESPLPFDTPFTFDLPGAVIPANVFYVCILSLDINFGGSGYPVFNNPAWSSITSENAQFTWFIGPSALQQSVTVTTHVGGGYDNLIYVVEGIFA